MKPQSAPDFVDIPNLVIQDIIIREAILPDVTIQDVFIQYIINIDAFIQRPVLSYISLQVRECRASKLKVKSVMKNRTETL